MKEKDIIHEHGSYWIGKDRENRAYIVFKNGVTHSVSDSAYTMDEDGLSCAMSRCEYLAKREKEIEKWK